VGAVYHGGRVAVIAEIFGNATLSSQPPVGQLLGTGQHVFAHWEHGVGNVIYEVVFAIYFVEGVCSDKRR
jgi:hypothetical protein